jgi:hypothetical protein
MQQNNFKMYLLKDSIFRDCGMFGKTALYKLYVEKIGLYQCGCLQAPLPHQLIKVHTFLDVKHLYSA